MKDTINILEGSTFVTSDNRGDIDGTPATPHGLFALDTRFLSRWKLTVDGQSPAPLSTDDLNYYQAQFFLAPSTGTTYVDAAMSVIRKRSVGLGMDEQITILNHSPKPKTVDLRIELAADFADLFEVKDALEKKGQLYTRREDNQLILGYKREDFVRETKIRPSSGDPEMNDDSLRFKVELPPNGRWETTIRVEPSIVGAPTGASADATERMGLAEWNASAPKIECDWRPIERVYHKSLTDLASLRYRLPNRPDAVMPAAGLPWFMSLFGRDSIFTSYQALPFVPELAEMTLDVLGEMQGRRVDDFRDEEPGKILHELRFGELTAFEERPHSPYFGAADSTTLWLVLLDEFERWSGRADVVRRLEPNARAALDWIDNYGDRDGDGYIEYDRRNVETGLENQCWKDSGNSILFSNGELARRPLATCELQGYAYDAKHRMARIARDIWGDATLADRLESEAARLKAQFNRDYWIADKGYFALALDGDKKQVDSLTSNIGHLLWSGIVDDDKAAKCVEHLMGDRLFSGWGVRTMADGEGGYNPIGYHVGTVWPHDNSIIAMGLVRYGYRHEASMIAQAMIEAATFFNNRLPEAFAGYERSETHYPAEYPTACSPQAWATGAPLLCLRAILGLEPRGDMLQTDPVLPPAITMLEVHGIPGRWGREDAGLDAADTVFDALNAASEGAPAGVRELFARLEERFDPASTRGLHTSFRFDFIDGESWHVAVDNGRVKVGQSKDEADCVLEMREETLLAMLGGSQNSRTALLSGKVKVYGDWSIASKLGRLLEPQEDRAPRHRADITAS